MSKPKINLYIDVVSPFSLFAYTVVKRYRAVWKDDVEVHIIPAFLGGIMKGTGNRPPITVPAKGVWMRQDLSRATKYLDISFQFPDTFPVNTLKAMRILTALKYEGSDAMFEQAAEQLWTALFNENRDTSQPDVLREYLKFLPGGFDKWEQLSNSAKIKAKLTENTEYILKSGSFGAPWWELTNKDGAVEYWWGSDRYVYIWDFLGLPWNGLFPKGLSTDNRVLRSSL